MENGKTKKTLIIVFISILIAIVVLSIYGILRMGNDEILLQGQIEATEISISGTLPGRIEAFYVEDGQRVKKGDTLVHIHSAQAEAKYGQVKALESIAVYQNQKIDAGTRIQIVASLKEIWLKTQSDLALAKTTLSRIENLYKEGVVTSQRKDEMDALYQSALAAERTAYYQYQMAVIGAQKEDKESSKSLVSAAQSTVSEVQAVLEDAKLTAPESGEIGKRYVQVGELAGVGTPILNLILIDKSYMVLNVREDLMPHFKMGGILYVDIPAIARKKVPFKINYISPLGSFATWKSTKQMGSYDLRTFELHADPIEKVEGLRPGMSALLVLEQ